MRVLPGYEMASNTQPYIVKTGFICAIVRFRGIIAKLYRNTPPTNVLKQYEGNLL